MAKKKKKSNNDFVPTVVGTSLILPVKNLRRNIWNYNEMDEVAMEKLKGTIAFDGFVQDIIVFEPDDFDENGQYEIIDGEHRWFVAKELGMAEVPCKNLGKLQLERAKALTIKLNELSGRPDTERLALIVSELVQQDFGEIVSTLPFDEEEINDMNRMARESLDDVEVPDSSGDAGGERKPRKNDDKYDIHTILKLGNMTDDEEEEFVGLLRECENVMGIDKKPYRIIIRLMRDRIKKVKADDERPRKKKKKKKVKNAS